MTLKERIAARIAERAAATDSVVERMQGVPGVVDPSRPLRGCPVAIVDTETTGTDPSEARIVEVAVTHWELRSYEDVESTEPHVAFRSLVNPGIPIPSGSADVHGITDPDVVDAPTWNRVQQRVLDACRGRMLCAYKAPYDHRVVCAEQSRVDAPAPPWPWIDAFVAGRHVDQYERGKGLGSVAARRGVLLDAHGAAGDTVATATALGSLLRELARGERRIALASLGTVGSYLEWQRGAALSQERDLAEFFAASGRHSAPDHPWHDLEGLAPPPFEGPAPKHAFCRTCGVPIYWAITKAGKRIPLDVDELRALVTSRHPKDAFRVSIVTKAGDSVRGWAFPGESPQARDDEEWAVGHGSHLATCPQAKEHRRNK